MKTNLASFEPKNRARAALISVGLFLAATHAWCTERVLDLNGFRIWQYREVVEKQFGPAFKKFEHNGKEVEAHMVAARSYMVFEYWKKFPRHVFSIQITGYPSRMSPFKGLVLGDSEEKVIAALGKPSSKEKLNKPIVTIYRYEGKNYEVEVDEHGKLYTIKLHFDASLLTEAESDDRHWEQFRKAVLSRDPGDVFQWLRPDIQILRDGTTQSINTRYGDFARKPEPAFITALLGERASVRSQIQKATPKTDYRLFIGQEGADQGIQEMGLVYKFPDDPVLAEILFLPYDGKYRVSEIRFRSR